MSASMTALQPSHPTFLDDEITALSLQLEEITYRDETQKKGKYPADKVPDLEIAYGSYLAEIESHLAFLKDVKLAHSIANAVDTDGQAITEFTQAELQAQDDRRYAVRISADNPDLEEPPPYTEQLRSDFVEDEVICRIALLLVSDDTLYEDPETEAGPSVPYAQLQARAMGQMSHEAFECCAYREDFRWDAITELACEHQYCAGCLKRVILRAVTDRNLAYLPPRCCKIAIPFFLVVSNLDKREIDNFQLAEVKKATKEKTYCSSPDCGRFLAPQHISVKEATRLRYNSKTRALCKNASHQFECPVDPAAQATLELGHAREWQSFFRSTQQCYSCRALVEIDWGCNHMT